MNLILSIRPEYVREIMEGQKKYEFRRSIFKNREVKTIYIYTTSPVKKIEGRFSLGGIYEGHPKLLWRRYGAFSGLKKGSFFDYFRGTEHGYAIRIECLRRFKEPVNPKCEIPGFNPPQNFCYFDDELD